MKYVWNRRETFFSGYVPKRKSFLEALATKTLSLGCEPGKKNKYIMYLMSNCMSLLLLSNYIWLTEKKKKKKCSIKFDKVHCHFIPKEKKYDIIQCKGDPQFYNSIFHDWDETSQSNSERIAKTRSPFFKTSCIRLEFISVILFDLFVHSISGKVVVRFSI